MRNESFDLEARIIELEKQVDALASSLHNHLRYVTPCGPIPQPKLIEPKPMTEEKTKEILDLIGNLFVKK